MTLDPPRPRFRQMFKLTWAVDPGITAFLGIQAQNWPPYPGVQPPRDWNCERGDSSTHVPMVLRVAILGTECGRTRKEGLGFCAPPRSHIEHHLEFCPFMLPLNWGGFKA